MQEFIYRPNDNGTYAVVGYQGDEANVRIPDTYGGGIITIVGDKLFSGHAEIESVSIPDTVTDMGEFVFDGCVNLRCIDLPADLECLWGYTFVRCGIEEITLPDKLVTLPPFAFKDCKNLRKITCGQGSVSRFKLQPSAHFSPDVRGHDRVLQIGRASCRERV